MVNVTARIENALNIPIKSLDFGTVFPQEKLDKTFAVSLSQSFRDENRVDDVEYRIKQKPKCERNANAPTGLPPFGQVTEGVTGEEGEFYCKDQANYHLMPLLCPYLSKTEISTDGTAPGGENDKGPAIKPFHGPITLEEWTNAVSNTWATLGRLAKSEQDFDDTWNIDLKTPCFEGHCAQDWEDFVHEFNAEAVPADYVQPIANEHQLFGCDLWLEVFRISLPGLGCKGAIDLMLVLDRSGSIDPTELQTVKDAANAFVTALAPSTAGTHVGQTSFSDTGLLDLHLTDSESAAHAAVNALVSGGFTNLFEGLDLANGELDNAHEHERPAIHDVMVVITDGNPNRPPDDANARAVAKAEADAARAAGVEIFVIGVGSDVDAPYLKTIADNDAHYFPAANFSDLQTVLLGLTACTD